MGYRYFNAGGRYMSMDVSISERNLKRIQRKMDSGIYTSADDVVNAALALLERLDPEVEREWADMRESVRQGLEELDAGLGIPTDEVFDEILKRSAKVAHEE
jgi:Arc/MetJ-type ribon-helix-helix transcriptional regulator